MPGNQRDIRDGTPWDLEAFINALVVELDKAQDTLALKGVTRPLSYTVRDVSLELHANPTFDGRRLQWNTARPGDAAASKISISLGSISDRQIRETTKTPVTRDDVSIDALDEIDEDTRATLRRIGVTTGKDLERLETRNIDLEKASAKKVNYSRLANLINQARRRQLAPRVSRVSVSKSGEAVTLSIEGDNLALVPVHGPFPLAAVNGQRAEVVGASKGQVHIALGPAQLRPGPNRLHVALDPYSVLSMNLES